MNRKGRRERNGKGAEESGRENGQTEQNGLEAMI